jgi:hypothetical protein
MSVSRVLQVVEILRANGVPVTFEPGWETRGNGQSSAYEGGIVHHVAGSYANTCPDILINGRSDLSGPLCNFAGLAGGGIHVVAAHPANHAGASGGPSNGPFPVTGLFNRLVMGLEICYPGSSPMTAAQYRSATVFAYAMAVLFGDIQRARAHAETSREGKWDPGYAPGLTIDMAAFRRAATTITAHQRQSQEDDVALAAKTFDPTQKAGQPETAQWEGFAVPPVGGSLSVPSGTGQAWLHLACPNKPAVLHGVWFVVKGQAFQQFKDKVDLKHDSYWSRQLPVGCTQVSVLYSSEVPIFATLETKAA